MTKLSYPPPYMTIDVLAQHLCVCPDTIERWTACGVLPKPAKPMGVRLWRWASIDKTLLDGPPKPEVQSEPEDDPFVAGAQRAATERKRHGRAA